ncbi:MAG: ABC transporter substrate-binding protein [Pseudomonadota bacterium]
MSRLLNWGLAALLVSFCWLALLPNGPAKAGDDTQRANVVSIGNDVTEIVFALGQGHRLVARDSTSTYPPLANDLPDIGYMRALSAEGVLSVGPEVIISREGAGPPEVIDVLKASGIAFHEIPDGYTVEAITEKVMRVGAALGAENEAASLSADIAAQIADAVRNRKAGTAPKRVMFIISAQGGKLTAAGQGTSAEAIIELAGGVNAVTGYEGYKIIEDEAATAAAPDVILMMDRGGNHSADAGTLFALPSLAATPAAQQAALVKMEGQKLLGFGPRTAEAVRELNTALYGAP